MVNPGWFDVFPNSEGVFLAPGVSDHCSLVVSITTDRRRKKPFKIFNFWMKNPNFKEVLVSSWSAPVEGRSPLLQFSLKLRRLNIVLKELNVRYYSNVGARVEQARIE